MQIPVVVQALTRRRREKRYAEAGEEWTRMGFVETSPGNYMMPSDLTPSQRRSVAAGNRIHPHQRFSWSVIHQTGVRYDSAGFEKT
jgi:hypothetical protein